MELIRQESNDWVFDDSTISHEVDEEFDAALEAADQGDLRLAERIARRVLRKCPDHIDALHHLALWLGERGDTLAAYVHCQAAVAIGLQAIPPAFNWKRSRLRWGYLENRPFMRAYQALALHRMDQRAWDDRSSPLVARELLAKRHPEPDDCFAGSYVVGGPSEAWVYWDAYGTYWRRSKDAMKLLRELASVA